eukprot:Hpha_TRINITY_DN16289_c0_g1::TRINITY_DN16289_c0_g1_i1::g.14344::m.14344
MFAVIAVAAMSAMNCPGSGASVHCGMRITTTAATSCANVKSEAQARVAGQYAKWHDPHNNGTYTAENYGGSVSFSRVTGNGKYTDKMIFTLTDQSDSCLIEACSESQVFSIGDMGTNYCDLKMLYCGAKDGCKPVLNDFTVGDEKTEKFAESTIDLSSCLAV